VLVVLAIGGFVFAIGRFNVAATAPPDFIDAELFWVIKNGIRMTGMPAFGVNHKDEEIRHIVAFVRHVPQLTDAERQALKTGAGEEHHHDGEEAEHHH
jgi:mono/diheme cytochrome c family protein